MSKLNSTTRVRLPLFTLLLILMAPAVAWAADQAGQAAAVSGRAEVGRGGQWRPLWAGDPVYVGDQLRTGADGRIQVKFIDLSVINVSANSRLEVTEYLFKKGSERKSLLRLLRGKLRAVVSKYSGAGKNEYRFSTPTAVAGVRGTDLVLDIQPINKGNPPAGEPGENPEEYTTTLAVLEGEVLLRSILEGVTGEVLVNTGNLSRVSHGNAPETVRTMNESEKNTYRSASFAPKQGGPQFAGGQGGSQGSSEWALGDQGGEQGGGGESGNLGGGETFAPSTPPINEQPGTVEGLVPVTVEIRRVD